MYVLKSNREKANGYYYNFTSSCAFEFGTVYKLISRQIENKPNYLIFYKNITIIKSKFFSIYV